MKSALIFQKLIDTWHAAEAPTLEGLYACVKSDLSYHFRLSYHYVSPGPVETWSWNTPHVASFGERFFGSKGFLAPTGSFASITDDAHFQTSTLPQMRKTIECHKPILESANRKFSGFYIFYDRIMLPEKTESHPSWLLFCSKRSYLARLPDRELRLDPVDEQILAMCAAGETAKTIAQELKVSSRTVEHRLMLLKKQIGARTLPELISSMASADLDRAVNFAKKQRAPD